MVEEGWYSAEGSPEPRQQSVPDEDLGAISVPDANEAVSFLGMMARK